MINNQWKTALIAVASSVVTIAGIKATGLLDKDVILNEAPSNSNGLVNFANMPAGQPGDFTYAASTSSPAVVHIKAKSVRSTRQRVPSIFEDFFGPDNDFFGGPRNQEQESSGSGVIISSEGYIVTNNHVVEDADNLEVVTFNKKSYNAKVIGVDPSTDLAVIKIEGDTFPSLAFANSDDVKVGEWVLAVGNPFNLESTVTAGIISAIGRDISILKNKFAQNQQEGSPQGDTPIESFIQTDAAVNPGNSGGALVNLRGELIGINTAIASPNGAYAGYAFAVPSEIVKKVTTDLIKTGNVQRGYLGLAPVELNNKNYKELNTKSTEGIFVQSVTEKGAANLAGIKEGDVIIKVDGIETKSEPKFRELIGRKRPGDKVKVTILRDGSIKDYFVTLKNRDDNESLVRSESNGSTFDKMGIQLQDLSAKEKEKIGVRSGVKITKVLKSGFFARDTEIKDGFIITRVGNTKVDSIKDIKALIEEAKENNEDGILVCGVYEGMARNFCYGVALE